MSLRHWAYVAMLVFCLVGVLPLTAYYHLDVLRQWRRLLITLVVAGTPFMLWDLYATQAGQWRFDPHQTLRWRVAGLPLEEIAFFVVVPLASVITFEAVRVVRRDGRVRRPRQPGKVR